MMVIVVIYSYMYWGNLLGSGTPAGKALAYLSNQFEVVDNFVKETRARQSGETTDTERDTVVSANEAAPDKTTPTDEQNTPAHETVVSEEVEQTSQQQPAQTEPHPADSQAVKPIAANSTPSDDTADSVSRPEQPAETQTVAEQPVSVTYQYNQQRVTQDSSGNVSAAKVAPPQNASMAESGTQAEPQVEIPADEAPAAPDKQAGTRFVTPEIEQQLNNVDDSGHVINPSIPGEAVRQSWVEARKSFYRRDYEKSIENYKKVIENTQDNFDAYGELGNVYFNQGKNKEAADAYFQAASILIKHGQLRRAYSLMGLLRRLDAEKSQELYQLLEQSKS
jgi:tetratricopeptide (TPR) repeat protein